MHVAPVAQNQGRALAAQLQSGAKSCNDLSAEDFDHIGEYVMGRFLGSTSAHQAMNDRMRLMMGDQTEGRMHQLMGASFAGCATRSGAPGSSGYGGMMGPGMMGRSYQGGGFGPMMRSGDWSRMMGSCCAWRNMSRRDWQRLQTRLLGTNTTALLAGALTFLILRGRPPRHPPAAATPS